MSFRLLMVGSVVCSFCIAFPANVRAAGRVEFELVTQPGFSGLESRNWYRLLTELKVDGLRIRSARAADKLTVETAGDKSAPIYRVTGVLTEGNQLILPGGGKFTLRDGRRLGEWIARLRQFGPGGESSSRPVAFGLQREELEMVRKDLARPVPFSTPGAARGGVVEKIADKLVFPVALQRGARQALAEAGSLGEDLRGVAFGTALAYVLRPAGLGFYPRAVKAGQIRYEIRSGLKVSQAWPVGLSADEQRRKLAPGLFEFLDVEVPKGTSLATALAAMAQKIKVPLLVDHNALAVEDVDPQKTTVFVPPRRTAPSVLLSRLLGPAKLKYELRIDEADKPFLWITSIRRR